VLKKSKKTETVILTLSEAKGKNLVFSIIVNELNLLVCMVAAPFMGA